MLILHTFICVVDIFSSVPTNFCNDCSYYLFPANLFRVGVDPDDEDFEEESSFQPVCSSVGSCNNHSRSGKRSLSQIVASYCKCESKCFLAFIRFRKLQIQDFLYPTG